MTQSYSSISGILVIKFNEPVRCASAVIKDRLGLVRWAPEYLSPTYWRWVADYVWIRLKFSFSLIGLGPRQILFQTTVVEMVFTPSRPVHHQIGSLARGKKKPLATGEAPPYRNQIWHRMSVVRTALYDDAFVWFDGPSLLYIFRPFSKKKEIWSHALVARCTTSISQSAYIPPASACGWRGL